MTVNVVERDQKRELLRRKLPRGSRLYTVRLPSKGHRFIVLAVVEGRVENITLQARLACGLSNAEEWTRKGTGYNHAADIVEDIAMSLYDDGRAFSWEGLNPK